MTKGPNRTPILARILRRVPEMRDQCWIVRTQLLRNGYAAVADQGPPVRNLMAHRVVYEHFRGPIPDGMEIDHLCAQRACVNPWHLEPVTHAENILRGRDRLWARRETCAQGHPLAEVGVREDTFGHRRCRACYSQKKRKKVVTP